MTTHRLCTRYLLLVPAVVLLAAGLVYPLIGLWKGGIGRNAVDAVGVDTLLRVQWITLQIATEVACIVTATALALALLVRALPRKTQRLVLFVCVFPIGVNIAFRVFGVQFLLATSGELTVWVHRLWPWVTVVPSSLLFTQIATVIGLVHWLIPVASLVVISSSLKLREDLIDSAELLGARRLCILFKVVIPMLLPSILLAFVLCFCLAYGAFITPQALGGLNDVTLSRLIGSLLNEGQAESASAPALLGVATPLLVFLVGAALLKLLGGRRAKTRT